MKTLYLDIFSGISGDMFLGALIDLGVDEHRLQLELGKLGLNGYHIHVERRQKSGIAGVKFDVHLESDHHHHHHHDHHHAAHGQEPHAHGDRGHSHDERTFAEIRKMIDASGLSDWIKQKSIAVFQRIANAEGKIHGKPPETVHFHEVGAVDSIIDIVGVCIGLEMLGRPRVLAAPVIEGTGWVNCAHGRFPVPTPATLAILGARGAAITQCDEPHELVTPTGAALLAEFAETFAPMHRLVADKIGFGLGSRENRTRPNLLRAVLGTVASPTHDATNDWDSDTIAVLETNLDDINPEILGNFVEKAFDAGALDVYHTPVQMKKNRPGIVLSVLCGESDADRFTELMLRETSAFGVRRHLADRRKLKREFTTVKTPFGDVTVKLGRLNGKIIQAAPEFESCRRLAASTGAPIKDIYASAIRLLDK